MNIRIIAVLVSVSVLLFNCGSSNSVTNDLAVNSPIETHIDLSQVREDKSPVIINPGRFIVDTVIYRLPRVVQGTYSVSDFGKYVDGFKAYDYKGNLLSVNKLDDNSWSITNAKNLDKISYLINDTFDIEEHGGIGGEQPFSPAGTNIEPQNYVLNLHGFIGYFDNLKNNQYKLDVTAPVNFVRTSALQNVSEQLSTDGVNKTISYHASRYFDITDNPMMLGELDVEEFDVDNIKIVLSVYSPNKVHTAASLKKTIFKMMQAQKRYLGDINSTPRYDIYLYLSEGKEDSPKGFGALEHHTSTVVVLKESMGEEALAKAMIDVVSHEFFHIVSPLSVHSEDIHYFDYNNPTFSKHLWMYEGVTEYFATLFQLNQGLVDNKEFYNKIMKKLQVSLSLNDALSFTEMSENVLDKPYASQYYNVYQKGALIGMCLDLILREQSNGSRGILSLMKELSNKYGKNKPFDDDKIIDEIVAMTYPELRTFFDAHVIGNTPINYEVFFNKAGLKFGEDKIKTNFVQNGGELIFGADHNTGAVFFTDLVTDNSFWTKNGVKPNDIVKSVNGKNVSLGNANQIFQDVYLWELGKEVEVVVKRLGKDIVIKTITTQSYTKGKVLVEDESATKSQLELRNAWLKG